LELADHSVDAVYSQDMLHQVDKPELIMEEIKRVLKPDGYFMQYSGKSLYTPEQEAANQKYNEAQKDIQSFYDTLISESGYGIVPFQDWDKARDCVTDNFIEHIGIMEWTLKLGLHKTKTRASGSKQLIPDDIHNNAWAKTDEYAKSKYGENYEELKRYNNYNFVNGMALYKLRIK
jgi:SAM-dependent methyltransferase